MIQFHPDHKKVIHALIQFTLGELKFKGVNYDQLEFGLGYTTSTEYQSWFGTYNEVISEFGDEITTYKDVCIAVSRTARTFTEYRAINKDTYIWASTHMENMLMIQVTHKNHGNIHSIIFTNL